MTARNIFLERLKIDPPLGWIKVPIADKVFLDAGIAKAYAEMLFDRTGIIRMGMPFCGRA